MQQSFSSVSIVIFRPFFRESNVLLSIPCFSSAYCVIFFSRMVSQEAGCKKIKVFLPLKLAHFIAGILENQARRTGKRPLMTTFSVYNLARNNDFDSSKARDELGYTTRSYQETIRDEIAWLKKTGKIA